MTQIELKNENKLHLTTNSIKQMSILKVKVIPWFGAWRSEIEVVSL